MLKFAGIDTTAAGSPTWVPNWNLPMTAPQRDCEPLSPSDRYYRAGGREQAQIRLSQDGLVLKVLGMTFDTVTWISRIAEFEYGNYDDWEASVKGELLTRLTRYRNNQSLVEAYLRTLVAGLGRFAADRNDQNALSEAYEAWHDRSWQKRAPNWKYFTLYQTRSNEFLEHFVQGTAGRRLCITARGYIGLVQRNTKLQDHVVILTGHGVPLILRPRNGKYYLVGESYMEGIMDGEALERPDTRLEWIPIH
jgi:hypothetical protein